MQSRNEPNKNVRINEAQSIADVMKIYEPSQDNQRYYAFCPPVELNPPYQQFLPKKPLSQQNETSRLTRKLVGTGAAPPIGCGCAAKRRLLARGLQSQNRVTAPSISTGKPSKTLCKSYYGQPDHVRKKGMSHFMSTASSEIYHKQLVPSLESSPVSSVETSPRYETPSRNRSAATSEPKENRSDNERPEYRVDSQRYSYLNRCGPIEFFAGMCQLLPNQQHINMVLKSSNCVPQFKTKSTTVPRKACTLKRKQRPHSDMLSNSSFTMRHRSRESGNSRSLTSASVRSSDYDEYSARGRQQEMPRLCYSTPQNFMVADYVRKRRFARNIAFRDESKSAMDLDAVSVASTDSFLANVKMHTIVIPEEWPSFRHQVNSTEDLVNNAYYDNLRHQPRPYYKSFHSPFNAGFNEELPEDYSLWRFDRFKKEVEEAKATRVVEFDEEKEERERVASANSRVTSGKSRSTDSEQMKEYQVDKIAYEAGFGLWQVDRRYKQPIKKGRYPKLVYCEYD